jgi:hypothetical protein
MIQTRAEIIHYINRRKRRDGNAIHRQGIRCVPLTGVKVMVPSQLPLH